MSGIGDTADSALHETLTALRLAIKTYHAEAWPLPTPETLVEHSGQFRLRIPRTLHARLAQRAADDGVSLNTYATSLLAAGIVRDESPKASAPTKADTRSLRRSR